MLVTVDNVLNAEELQTIQNHLATAEFVDGKLTAGRYAKLIKNNEQLASTNTITQELGAIVLNALKRHSLFQTAVRPRYIRPPLFSRYEPGMAYGDHTDNAIMGSDKNRTRSDVSLTLFLSEPDTYKGGELSLDTPFGEQQFKLPAGAMLFYPSTLLHSVTEVTEGVRFAAVTWVQSLVRDVQEREILFELEKVRRSLFEQQGKTLEFDLLSKTVSNLLRKWAEV
jgi:PKHD-type hydroxylase